MNLSREFDAKEVFDMKHRDLFMLDPGTTFLNHGSFGATPRPILEAQSVWRRRMENQPVGFMLRTLPPARDRARERSAQFVGADPSDLVFVRNATSGFNAIIQSLELPPGSRILATTHRYTAVGHALTYTAKRRDLVIDIVDIPLPLSDPGVVLERLERGIKRDTRLIVINQIASASALLLPVRQIASLAREHDCLLFVDGAHAPGQAELEVSTMGAHFWTGNLHKWLCAPKGCALLWVHPDLQDQIHPPVISNSYGEGYQAEFDWCGTDDPTPWLCAPDAIHLHENIFGGAAFRARNIALAAEAVEILCEALGCVPVTQHPAMSCALGAVLLDRPCDTLYADLSAEGFEILASPWGEQTILRVSAFSIYNEREQYVRLAAKLAELR